jgi:fibrillarin-like rRNA methylase
MAVLKGLSCSGMSIFILIGRVKQAKVLCLNVDSTWPVENRMLCLIKGCLLDIVMTSRVLQVNLLLLMLCLREHIFIVNVKHHQFDNGFYIVQLLNNSINMSAAAHSIYNASEQTSHMGVFEAAFV